MAKKDEVRDDTLAAAVAADKFMEVSHEIPAFIEKGNREGTDQIAPEDARIPRLVLAQPATPQAMKGDPVYIEGLQSGMSFNDLTNVIYGSNPLDVIVVRADKPRWVEFGDDRSVVDPSVPPGDPRTQFTSGENGKRVPPIATEFFDYIILLGSSMEPLALSFKGSAIKLSARPLNGLIKMKPVPIYACHYRLTPRFMKNDEGQWYVYSVSQVGFIANEETYREAKEAFDTFVIKKVDFDAAPPTEVTDTGTTPVVEM